MATTSVSNTTIVVDRLETPSCRVGAREVAYPQRFVYPELQTTGPDRFSSEDVVLWLSHKQKFPYGDPRASGHSDVFIRVCELHEQLVASGMIAQCMSLSHILAIKAMGVDFFLDNFAKWGGDYRKPPILASNSTRICAWKSVGLNEKSGLCIPYIGLKFWPTWMGKDPDIEVDWYDTSFNCFYPHFGTEHVAGQFRTLP